MTYQTKFLLTALALAVAPPAMAQSSAKKPAPATATSVSAPASPTSEQQADFRRAIMIFRSFGVAIESKNVKTNVKNRLVVCLYTNKLGDISRATAKVIKAHPNLSDDKPADVWRAAAGVCGIVFNKAVSTSQAPSGSGTPGH